MVDIKNMSYNVKYIIIPIKNYILYITYETNTQNMH